MSFVKSNTALTLSLLFIISVSAQTELYIPKEIAKGYLKNTRSYDGRPGSAYWQNFTRYQIDASINTENKILTGSENIKYFNNSPDTLKTIVLKLYQNMNKTGAVRNAALPENAVTNGMNVSDIRINNSDYPDDLVSVEGTNMILKLSESLAPADSMEIDLKWSFTIPPGASNPRMGFTDSASFFLGYWYPKVAVYDDLRGWDMLQYDGEHEFYFEYSDYNVNITMPSGYLVWATGIPQNIESILSVDILTKYRSALVTDTVIKIINTNDIAKKNIFRNRKENVTWNYKAFNVPDFAFGTASNYVWHMTTKKLNGRIIRIQTAFNPKSESYNEVIYFAKGALDQYAEGLPGIPYPYPQITIFNGDSGMEFPMIVNDAAFPNRSTDVYVTIHEITHMFFPFYCNMSETMYGWFDEGMAYFLPQKIQLSFDPSDHRIRAARGYSRYAGSETDLPLMTPSYFVKEPDLSMLSYYKSAIAFDMLRSILGDELFKQCLVEFISRWNGKHPTPYDFFFTFNNVSGKDLNWFWQKWFFEKGFPDLGIKDVKSGEGKIRVLVERIGNYPVPVNITVTAPDGRKEIISGSADIWSDNKKESWIEGDFNFDTISADLGAPWIPDSNPANNHWEQK